MGDIAVNILDQREQGGDSTFFDGNLYTPPANRTVLAINYVVRLSVAAVNTPAVSGNNLTWTLVFHQTFDHAGVDRGALTVHRGIGSAPTNARTRVTYPNTQLRNSMAILEAVNTDIGAGGANAIAQFKSTKIAASVTKDPSITLDNPAAQSNNSLLSICGYGNVLAINPFIVPGAGITSIGDFPTTEAGGHAVGFKQVLQQLADWSADLDTFAWAPAAIELQNAETPPDPDQPQVIGRPSLIQGNLITP